MSFLSQLSITKILNKCWYIEIHWRKNTITLNDVAIIEIRYLSVSVVMLIYYHIGNKFVTSILESGSRVVSLITRPHSFDPRADHANTPNVTRPSFWSTTRFQPRAVSEGRFLISYLSNERMNGILLAVP